LEKFLKRKKRRNPLIVIVGPTASGKSELAIKIASFFNGEVISADSRQIYKGMDIGTGKVTKKETKGIPHHLLSIVSPKKRFTVALYQKLAFKVIEKIIKKGKLPILCGGSAFYIQSVTDGIIFPNVPPIAELRKKLSKKSSSELYKILLKLDPNRAKNIDKNNRVRLIRAIEIAKKIGKVPPLKKKNPKYDILILGIKREKDELKRLIKKRLLIRIKKGMISEVKKLKNSGLSWKKLESFGLEYKWVSKYLKKEIDYKTMIEKLEKDIYKFAKRQMTWFKKDKRIKWIKNYKEAKIIIKKFLDKKNNLKI
jgi:tRNA dimethylallyltransferase